MLKRVAGLLLPVCLVLAGCFNPSQGLPAGEAAYDVIPAADPNRKPTEYRVGVLDTIAIRVFQEPELSFDKVTVNSSGTFSYPFVGEVTAQGKTTVEISRELEAGLGARYIRNPQVVVSVLTSAAQRVVVDGQVTEPGVYDIAGESSLLEAIARAQGLTFAGVEDEVIIFRVIDGERFGAVFNLRHIREGRVADPQVLGGDRIVVGYSALRAGYQDFLRAAPILNVFRRF
ncbi:polysaccharide biosynthesis/export family protein [Qipengyuania sp.]|uniref:polysaccharide biosynthesis/export family protein n=1 Tax=Qipengyuania sp. TaxID=2004515 RepID=UPI0037361C99